MILEKTPFHSVLSVYFELTDFYDEREVDKFEDFKGYSALQYMKVHLRQYLELKLRSQSMELSLSISFRELILTSVNS